jgi:peptide/nickel transport system permease protein
MTTETIPTTVGRSTGVSAARELNRLEKLFGPEWYRILRSLLRNPLSVTGILIISGFVLVGIFAPVLAPPVAIARDPYLIPRDGFNPEPRPPGSPWLSAPPDVPFWYKTVTGHDEWVHLLGTASGQFDIYYGIIWGTRTALKVGVFITLLSATVGIIIGAVAGFYGGLIDEALMRVVEIFQAFPFLVGAFVIATILVPRFGRSIWPATIALIIFGWTGYARLLRGDILSTKERDYVLAARASGARDSHLIMRHILPNAIYPTLVVISLDMGSIVLAFAALSFLGVGTDIGYADWGQVVSFARDYIFALDQHWHIIVYPGLALLLYGLGWNLVGDALRDILDPRMRGVRG